jgi:hypothetical protein
VLVHNACYIKPEAYTTHDLSKKCLEARKNTELIIDGRRYRGDFGNSNYAVYDYEDLNGQLQHVVRRSTRIEGSEAAIHSEELCEQFLREQNIPNANVKRIYSERSPCSGTEQNCGLRIAQNFTGTEVSYTWDYLAPGMNKDMKKFIKELLKANPTWQRLIE